MQKIETKLEKLEILRKIILGIENNEIDLIEIKDKHNKDVTWTISLKISIKKEVEELKKHCITFDKI